MRTKNTNKFLKIQKLQKVEKINYKKKVRGKSVEKKGAKKS